MSVRDLIILGTSSQQPTRFRNHGAYLFRWNNEGLLFDPGEGTQRQFIFVDVAPPTVTRIFISHFHGDHCLGFGSMLMRLNLDKVDHEIHCYYPASGEKYFQRLRYGTMYHETIKVVPHPISEPGIIHKDDHFTIEADLLKHSAETWGFRVTEPDEIKFQRDKLKEYGIVGPMVRELQEKLELTVNGKKVTLADVSYIRKGDSIAYIADTSYCESAISLAKDARILLSESTYLEEHAKLAKQYRHLTAMQAATIAKKANAQELILTHFSARYPHTKPFEEEARTIFKNTHAARDLKVFPFPKNKLE
jgi:ribonuclease Z